MANFINEKIICECICENPRHLLVFQFIEDREESGNFDGIDVYFTSNYRAPLKERIKNAFKHIFCKEGFLTGDAVLFNHTNLDQLENVLNTIKERREKAEKK